MLYLAFSPSTIIDAGKYQPKEFRESEEREAVAEDPLMTLNYSTRYLYGFSGFSRTGLKIGKLVHEQELILQGGADSAVDPVGTQQLPDVLPTKEKSLIYHMKSVNMPPRMCLSDWS